jgi:hypothetical protein
VAKRPLAKDSDKFIVRLPEGMRDRIAQAAEEHGNSMNAEVVARLESSFDPLVRDDHLATLAAKLEKSERTCEVQGIMLESLSRENEALKKTGIATENLLLMLAGAVNRAASGDETELRAIIEREKADPTFRRMKTIWSVIRED